MELLIDLEDEPEPIVGLDVRVQMIEEEIDCILHPEKRFWLN